MTTDHTPAAAPSAPAPAEVPMPERQRYLLCGKCRHSEPTKAALNEYPSCPRCTYATFVIEAEPPREAWLAYAAAREAAAAGKLRGATAALLEIEAELERVRVVLEAAQNDAMRFRWLTEDHADPQTRAKCRDLLSRMGVMTYSAACRDIDSAMAQTTKREMLRTAVEWQRRCEPTCAHGRYSDEDCADCPRTAAAARAELGDEAETARRREKEKLMGGIL